MTAFAARHGNASTPTRPAPRKIDFVGPARRALGDEFLVGQAARARRRLLADPLVQLLDK